MLQVTTEGPDVWVAAVTSGLISWWQRDTSLQWDPLVWLVDVAGLSPPLLGRVSRGWRSDPDSARLDEFTFKQTPLGFSPEACHINFYLVPLGLQPGSCQDVLRRSWDHMVLSQGLCRGELGAGYQMEMGKEGADWSLSPGLRETASAEQ